MPPASTAIVAPPNGCCRVQTFQLSRADQPDGSNPCRRPHYLLLNLALGGSWGREIDDTIFPQRFVVDYVRVYRRAS